MPTRKKSKPRPPHASEVPARPTEQSAGEPTESAAPSFPFPVVGIGASAGGLDAFKRFFSALPADSGMAFVLIPHLAPTHRSLMTELLSRQTAMKVREVTEGMPIEPNCVYIIPPDRDLTIRGRGLHLSRPVQHRGTTTAIDGFFRSLAENCQEKAIGIVLSGTGSHGTAGLKEIKAAGGLIVAQEPQTADYDQMPQNAINTGLIDYVLPPEKMPEVLVNYARHPYVNAAEASVAESAAAPLKQLLELLRIRTGYDFRSYRKNMLMRRIQRRMGICRLETLPDYIVYLRGNAEEVTALYRDLLITVTSFFRDAEAFETLQQKVIPELVTRMTAKSPLRIWVPGCATGEEAYSLAILILEHCATTRQSPNLQIFASDIDEQSLEVARRGIYTASAIADVSPNRLQRFFVKQDENHYQVNSQLRAPVVVTRQNVISDPPFSRLDLISCRNVLIYFEPDLQQKILSLFHFGLNERGFLFLGTSETVGQQTNLFETVSSKWRVFQRLGPARPERQPMPVFGTGERRGPLLQAPPAPRMGFSELMQKLLLARFAPAAVLIDRRYEVLSFFGAMSDYLEFPAGEPTMNLLSMARRGLRTKIRFACQKVLSGEADSAETEAQLQRQGTPVTCLVTANRLHEPREAEGLLLIVFRDHAGETPTRPVRVRAPEEESAVVRQLEHEVEATREDLQGTIEELQSSNEEVMSMNEELQSANEELESSKEELQSFNEELSTVNAQLQGKVEELERTNDDIRNLLNSTEIATIFLDTDLRIRRFTPPTTELLNIIDADIGRPVSDLAPKYKDDHLMQDARRVLDTLVRIESEVHSDAGRWYLRRILPYRTSDNRIDGVAVTFVDITERTESEAQSRLLSAVLRDANDAVMVLDLQGKITTWNHGAERMYGYSQAEAQRHNIRDLVPEEGRAAQDELIARAVRGEQVSAFETIRVTRDGRLLDVWLTITRLTDERGRPVALATTERDVTERNQREAELQKLSAELETRIEQRTSELKATNAELRRREHEFRALADNVPALFSYIDANQRYRYVNKQYEFLFQRPAADIVGKTVVELVGETNYQVIEPYLVAALNGQRVEYESELDFPAGHRAHRARLVPEQDEQGQVVGFFTLVDDITERKRTESALGEQQRRLQAIVDTAADAIITIDERGRIDTFNRSAEKMFGYTAAEVIGQNVKMLMPPPYREEHDGYLANYLATGDARIIGIGREIVAQRQDGTVFPIDLAVSKLHDETQDLFTGIIRDLSERKALQKDLLTILADEQRRIGQDLHDVVGQELTGLSLLAASLTQTLRESNPGDAELADRIAAGIGRALDQVRQLSKGLVPVEVDAEGLRAALTELADRVGRDTNIRCEFQCDQPVPIENNETATHLFRIAQEAVTNALKHGSPRNIRIALKGETGRIVLEIRDDGTGLPAGAWQADGMGLKTMQYRAALIGATLSIAPLKRKGTLVTCHLMELRSHG